MIVSNLIIFFLLNCFQGLCSAQNSLELFLQANETYSSGDLEAALRQYESIEKKGSATWFNMGNCLFGLERYPEALVCWRRAQSHAPLFFPAEEHCTQAREKLGLSDQPNARWLFQCGRYLVTTSSRFSIQILFLLLWILAFLYVPRCFQNRKWVLTSSFFVTLGMLILVLVVKWEQSNTPVAIVMQSHTPVYVGPNEQFSVHTQLGCGQEVSVVQSNDSWYQIKAFGQAGWVVASAVTVI